jgi:hypothetical protein
MAWRWQNHWDPKSYGKWIFKKKLFYIFILVFNFFNYCFHFLFSNFQSFFFCYLYKYNYIDKHLREKTLQHIISGELKRNCFLHYDEAFNEEKKFFEKSKVCGHFFFFNFFSLLLDSIKKLCRKSCDADLSFSLQLLLPKKFQWLMLVVVIYMQEMMMVIVIHLSF